MISIAGSPSPDRITFAQCHLQQFPLRDSAIATGAALLVQDRIGADRPLGKAWIDGVISCDKACFNPREIRSQCLTEERDKDFPIIPFIFPLRRARIDRTETSAKDIFSKIKSFQANKVLFAIGYEN